MHIAQFERMKIDIPNLRAQRYGHNRDITNLWPDGETA